MIEYVVAAVVWMIAGWGCGQTARRIPRVFPATRRGKRMS